MQAIVPLDPNSPKGREVAALLTETLAAISLAIAERRRAAKPAAGERAAA